jgi:Ca2+-binding RTX toxin-like protein
MRIEKTRIRTEGACSFFEGGAFTESDLGTMRRMAQFAVVALATMVISAGAAEAQTARCGGERATIVGTSRRDELNGTAGRDIIVALAGADTIRSRGGNDVVCAGGGDDTVAAGGGNDEVDLGAGGDSVAPGSVDDFVNGAKASTSWSTTRPMTSEPT